MQNSIPRYRYMVYKGIFFVSAIVLVAGSWFLGEGLARHLAEGKEVAVSSSESSQRERVAGVSDAREASKSIILEDLFPIEGAVPVRKTNSSDFALPNAHASIILDAESGTILFHQEGTERRQIASLTKIMTALLVMESVESLDEVVTITEDVYRVDGTVVGCPRAGYCISNRLVVGEKMTVHNLMRAMLMNSANDAALALAIHIKGSERAFVDRMNERARELGLKDTNFCTPSGLEIDGQESSCYSTAYDIARVAIHLLPYEEVWKIFQTPAMTITSVDGARSHEILNTDQILGTFPQIIGAKTGFTPAAGRSLLAVARDVRGDNPIVTVLLDDPYRWEDIKQAVLWAYGSYRWEE